MPIIMLTPSPNFFGSFLIFVVPANDYTSKLFFYPKNWNSKYYPIVFRFYSIYWESSLVGAMIMACKLKLLISRFCKTEIQNAVVFPDPNLL